MPQVRRSLIAEPRAEVDSYASLGCGRQAAQLSSHHTLCSEESIAMAAFAADRTSRIGDRERRDTSRPKCYLSLRASAVGPCHVPGKFETDGIQPPVKLKKRPIIR